MNKKELKKMRINKYLAQSGFCSRRQADELIKQGKVLINKQPARLGDMVSEHDFITANNKPISQIATDLVYILYNKPVGIIVTTDKTKKHNIIDAIHYPDRVFPVGRLDVSSSGLILLTNDGDLANKLIHPRYQHEREYLVEVDKAITPFFIKKMAEGIKLAGKKTLSATVKTIDKKTFQIVLKEGRNRQVRKMCQALDYEVAKLVRVRINNIKLKNLTEGQWRMLTKREVADLTNKMYNK